MGTHWSTTQLGGWMMDVHLVDLISLVHEPWPRQLDRKLDCYSTCARIQTPSCTKSRAERGFRLYNSEKQATPLPPIGGTLPDPVPNSANRTTKSRNLAISRPSRRFLSHKPTIGIRSGRAGLLLLTALAGRAVSNAVGFFASPAAVAAIRHTV